MGYYIVVGENEERSLATTLGWKLFKDWADTLPLDKYTSVIHLAEHGIDQHVSLLADQLESAISTGSQVQPLDNNVRLIARDLVESLRVGLKQNPDSACAFVSDGMGPDDGIDTDDDEDETEPE